MGCGSSTKTTVQPLTPSEVNGDEDETESKLGGRGDSAVSKGTADSGVVMENRDISALPGAVPIKLPPLTSGSARESEVDRVAQDGLLQQDSTVQERPKSSEILEELLNQGIISVGKTRIKVCGAGEAYSIMLDDTEEVRRRPPARLESLKAKKSDYNREEMDEKMRLAEERRKSREDELKMRLRSKSARVRRPAPIPTTEEDEDASLTIVEPLQSPLTPDPTPASPLHNHITHKATEGGERSEVEDGEKKEEELTQVEELMAGQLLTASGELENDSSFQHAEDEEEIF